MMKRWIAISVLAALECLVLPQAKADVEIKVDTVYIDREKDINDYSMLGVQYGVDFTIPMFTPDRNAGNSITPLNFSILYTRYGKLFGYMPYFGFQVGLSYNTDGYKFKKSNKGAISDILGATKVEIPTVEVPFMAHMHFDFNAFKIMANLGLYGAYRLGIHRSEYIVRESTGLPYDDVNDPSGYWKYRDSFHPNEMKWDYGMRAGLGIGLILDPVEIHLTASYKWSWEPLHQPNVNAYSMEHDDNSKYYYKWAYPGGILVSLGIHYQITRRKGTPAKELKRQAMEEAMMMYREAMGASVPENAEQNNRPE